MTVMTNDVSTRTRAPKGVPTGGEFQKEVKSEADSSVSLAKLHRQAAQQQRDAERTIGLTAGRIIAEGVLREFPDAKTLELEQSDQGDYFWTGRVLDATGDHIGDVDEIDEVNDYVFDVPLMPPGQNVQVGGYYVHVNDPAFDWLTVEDRFEGVEGRIDLAAASQIRIEGIDALGDEPWPRGTLQNCTPEDITPQTVYRTGELNERFGSKPEISVRDRFADLVYQHDGEYIRLSFEQETGRLAEFGASKENDDALNEAVWAHPVYDALSREGYADC